MRTLALLLLSLVHLTVWTLPAQAQSWSGILDRSRAIDWSSAGVPGGIPITRTQCGSMIAAYGTSSSPASPATINNALASCGANQYVQLGAGTFYLSASVVMKSNVTLRGMGPDQTILKFSSSGGGTCIYGAFICVGDGTGRYWQSGINGLGLSANWTAGYAQGTTTLTVASTSMFAVGQLAFLDQRDPSADNGGFITSCANSTFSSDCPGNGPNAGRVEAADGNVIRSAAQQVVITGKTATTLTISPGVYFPDIQSGRNPQVWTVSSSASTLISGAGVEDLTTDNYLKVSTSHINFSNAYASWVKNVRMLYPGRNGINVIMSKNIEVRNSYFYGYIGTGSTSYVIERTLATDLLIINNIFHRTVVGIMARCVGCVVAYNYSYDTAYGLGPCAFTEPNASACAFWQFASHGSGGARELWEGNDLNGINADNSHSQSLNFTFFRNALRGTDDRPTRTGLRSPLNLQNFARVANIVGNVLGTSGVHTTYQSGTSEDLCIYCLGLASSGVAFDPLVSSTSLRWGNYDTVTGTTRFETSEVPTSAIPGGINGNAVPASQTLPNSFFLSVRPSFWTTSWGTPAWPAIGPDVTGGDVPGVAGHIYSIPARLCFNNLANDTSANYSNASPPLKLYNANMCYSGSTNLTPPQAPQNLTVQ